MHLCDAHLHLQDPRLAPGWPAPLEQARAAGVRRFVCNGTSEADWPQVLALAQSHADVFPCFGLHPWEAAKRSDEWLPQLEQWLQTVSSGVGEIGLDRWIEPRDEAAQEEVFRAQLTLARRLNRPVMIHCVRAWGWLLDVLRAEPLPAAGGLIHACGCSPEMVRPLADLGAWFSFAGNVLDERQAHRRKALRAVPLDRLLIETDAPDLPPPAAFWTAAAPPAKVNQPANLPGVLRGVAAALDLPPERLAEITWENSVRFLGPHRTS